MNKQITKVYNYQFIILSSLNI